jgi:phosphoribosylformimino-5-aminoimidazole carboxamide ribotide isomerase
MRFRPCIDLHQGRVKQIVGGSFRDDGSGLITNFDTDRAPGEYARLYRSDGLEGGHVIMLGPGNEDAALEAVRAYPGGLQVGGGMNPDTAGRYLDAGASHVIVTSYVFRDGAISWANLEAMASAVGPEKLVVDLSCVMRAGEYWVVTDRWQNVSNQKIDENLLGKMVPFCAEFLVHAADVEGQQGGIAARLVAQLAQQSAVPVTYAGGIRSLEDLDTIDRLGNGRVDATVGSALDIFGGSLAYKEVVSWHAERQK